MEPGNISPRRPQQDIEHPSKKKEEDSGFGHWFADWVEKIFGVEVDKTKDEYFDKEGHIVSEPEPKLSSRAAEQPEKKESKRIEFNSLGIEVPEDPFSQAVVEAYNKRISKHQEKSWDIIFVKLESIFEGFDRKQYAGNPIKFFSDFASGDIMAKMLNKIILSDEQVAKAWEIIKDERRSYFYDLVDNHHSNDVEYKNACERFDQLIEMKEMGIEFDRKLKKEYKELMQYLVDRARAYFNSMEARYYANDPEFQHSLKVVQDMKNKISEKTQSSDLSVMADALHREYLKRASLEDIDNDDATEFKEAVDYINEREVVLKALFNFGYSVEEVKANIAIPSLSIAWEDIQEQAVRDKEFVEKHPGVEFMPELGVVAFVMTSPVSYPTNKVGDLFADHLGRKTVQPMILDVKKESEKLNPAKVKIEEAKVEAVSSTELSPLSFENVEYKKAAKYVDDMRAKIEKKITREKKSIFNDAWDVMFKKINKEILNGKSYAKIYKKYGAEWAANFKVEFGDVFGYAGSGLSSDEAKILKAKQKDRIEFGTGIEKLRKDAFYEEFKVFFDIRWEAELAKNKELRDSWGLVKETKRVEDSRNARGLMKFIRKIESDDSIKAFYKDPLTLRYKNVLEGANIQDYSNEEIKDAQIVVSKFFEAFKQHSEGKMDMTAWRIMVSREPMLGKAEALLFQKQYDSIRVEFRRQELLRKKEKGKLTPDELVEIEKQLSYMGQFKDVFSLFFKSLLPWNQIEGPQSLRAENELVVMNIMPFGAKETGDMLAWVAKSAGGKKGKNVARVVTNFAQKLDGLLVDVGKGVMDASAEFSEAVVDSVKTGKWNIDKNRYLVHDFTIDAKEGMVARGIKWMLQGIVEEPEAMKSQKWMPWLAKYGKAAVVGGFTSVSKTLLSGNVPTMTTVVAGAAAGTFVERYKGEIKAAVTFAIPGALAAAGIIVAVAGVGALIGTGGIVIVGLAAALFGIFGVWAMYHTETGKSIREGIANFVYSSELEWFKQWHKRVESADLARSVFRLTAERAEARSGQMYLRTELARDQRYKNLEDVCREVGLSGRAQDAFLEQVRRKPSVLSEPGQFLDLVKLIGRGMVTEADETKIGEIIKKYREKNKDILKVGLEGRYENLKNELMKFDTHLPAIIAELEGKHRGDLLQYDDKLKEMLVAKGISSDAIDRIFREVREVRPGGKDAIEDAYRITQAMHALVKAAGAKAEKVSEWGAYLASLPLGKVVREKKAAELGEIELDEYTRDEALIRVVLALREIIKQKDILADAGELKNLLVDVGFKNVDELYALYDEKNLMAQPKEARARMVADRREMEGQLELMDEHEILALDIISEAQERYEKRIAEEKKMRDEGILAYDIIAEAQRDGELKSDADLLSDDEIAEIRKRFSDDDEVFTMLERDKDIDIPSKIPSDREFMYRFGMVKVDHTGRILGVDELPDIVTDDGASISAREHFEKEKVNFEDNFDKLRIGFKREKLVQATMDELIQKRKEEYVAETIMGMSESERMIRIGSRNLQILEEYKVYDKVLY